MNFFDRVTEPLLIHHGESDSTCPIAWSRETLAALKAAGKDATMYTYPGEEHAFGPAWPTVDGPHRHVPQTARGLTALTAYIVKD